MFNIFKKKTIEQKALEHLKKYAKEINKDKLGPLGAIIEFIDEIKNNKLHQELNVINEKDLRHPKAYYLCASLMLLLYCKTGVYDSLKSDVDIEELAKFSYVANSQIITDEEFLKLLIGTSVDYKNKMNEDKLKHETAWENWLNNLDVLKSVFN